MINPDKLLSDIVVFTKYSRITENADGTKRKLNWSEIVDEYLQMMIRKYPNLREEIIANGEYIKNKKVFPSMRALQYAGKPIENNHARMYNCSGIELNDIKVFSEVMFLSLSGCGVGVSLKKKCINQLPKIVKPAPPKKFRISDSIEGWSDAIRILIYSYFRGNNYPDFDFSDIRPKGSEIKKLQCLAPGSSKLRQAIKDIDKILINAIGRQLTSIECLDIIDMIANSVVSGGIRSSAIITFADKDDLDIINAKSIINFKSHKYLYGENDKNVYEIITNDGLAHIVKIFSNDIESIAMLRHNQVQWYYIYPHRAMSNNSISETYDNITEEEFKFIMRKSISNGTGEPGILFTNSDNLLSNPCNTLSSLILTDKGYITFAQALELNVKELNIFNGEGNLSKSTLPFKTGENRSVTKIILENGLHLEKTENHLQKIYNGDWVKVENLKVGDKLETKIINIHNNFDIDDQDEYNDGLFFGWLHADGCHTLPKGSKNQYSRQVSLFFGPSEYDVIEHFEKYLGKKHRNHANTKVEVISFMNTEWLKQICEKYDYSFDKNDLSWLYLTSKSFKIGFLKSVFSADGCIMTRQHSGMKSEIKTSDIMLSSSRFDAVETILNIINEFGLYARLRLHSKARTSIQKDGSIRNNNNSYGIFIHPIYFKNIGFIASKKQIMLEEAIKQGYDVGIFNTNDGYEKMMNNKKNFIKIKEIVRNYSVEDVYDITVHDDTHSFIDNGTITHNCGEIVFESESFCNLTTINAYNIESQEDFNTRSKVASFFGTLQAGFIDFHYIRYSWKEKAQKQALLGVSLTGIAGRKIENLNEIEAAQYATDENERIANIIGINKADRVTCIKPEGTTTLVAEAFGAGVHSAFSDYYIRRIRIQKNQPIAKYLSEHMPEFIENDFMDSSKLVFSLPMKSAEGCITELESPIELLERIRRYNVNWIRTGHRNGASFNNVSATVHVDNEHVENVIDWIWQNRYECAGLTLLPKTENTYIQMPFEKIDKLQYEKMLSKLPEKIDLSSIDVSINRETTRESACSANGCEIYTI